MNTKKQLEYCPYCQALISDESRDHISPKFLGGQRQINCCKKCNDVFGHTFEAEAAKFLQPLHVFISSWGVPLKSADPTWRRAYVFEGMPLDLSVGETGVKIKLSKPIIERDETGKVSVGRFSDMGQAEKAARRMVHKGKAREVRLQQAPLETDLVGLEISLEIGPAIRRTSLKMCIAASTLLPDFNPAEVAEAQRILVADPSSKPLNTLAAYVVYQEIDSRRPALSHVIYVERNQDRVYGLVQFFGVVQLFCRLGRPRGTCSQAAVLAVLDPVTGNEDFSAIPPLNLPEPPFWIQRHEYPRLMEGWMKKFREEAIKRDATHPPSLKQVSLNVITDVTSPGER